MSVTAIFAPACLAFFAALPGEEEAKPVNGSLPARVTPGGLTAKCLIHRGDAVSRVSPDPAAAKMSAGNQVNYLFEYFVVDRQTHSQSSQEYLLLVRTGNGLIDPVIRSYHGWVKKSDCLLFSGSGPLAKTDDQTGIVKKAMLVNSLSAAGSAQTGNAQALMQPVGFRTHPGGEDQVVQRLFQIFYVYDEAEDHIFLGQQAEATDSRLPIDEILLGWVPSSRVCRWNTREAIELNPLAAENGVKVKFFAQKEHLAEYLETNLLTPEIEPLAQQVPKRETWAYNIPRYPVVSDPEVNLGESLEGTPIYKVGLIGDVFREGVGGPRLVLGSEELTILQEKASQLQQKAGKIQIHFVVDGTFSMRDWFLAAAEACRQIISDSQNLQGKFVQPQVEVAVSYYRDRKEQRERDRFESNPFGTPLRATTLLDKGNPIGGFGPGEQMYFGIREAIRQHPFDPLALKILVLVGDDGNDPADKTNTLELVCKDLIAAGGQSPIAFFALPVGMPETEQEQESYTQFQKDASAIAERLAAAELKQIREKLGAAADEELQLAITDLVGTTHVSPQPNDAIIAIRRRFALAAAELDFVVRGISSLQRGREQLVGSEVRLPSIDGVTINLGKQREAAYGVIWTARMDALFEQQGLDRLQLAREGVQLFEKAWVAEFDPLSTAEVGQDPAAGIRQTVLVGKKELTSQLRFLKTAVSQWDGDNMMQTWKRALNDVTGGDVAVTGADALSELSRLHTGIAFRSGVLSLTLDEFQRLSPQEKADVKTELERKILEIDSVLLEESIEVEKVEKFDLRRAVKYSTWVKKADHGKKDYWWPKAAQGVLGEFEKRAWLDRQLLP